MTIKEQETPTVQYFALLRDCVTTRIPAILDSYQQILPISLSSLLWSVRHGTRRPARHEFNEGRKAAPLLREGLVTLFLMSV